MGLKKMGLFDITDNTKAKATVMIEGPRLVFGLLSMHC